MTPEENERAREEAITEKIDKILNKSKSPDHFSLSCIDSCEIENVSFEEFGIDHLKASTIYFECYPHRLQNIKVLAFCNCQLETLEQIYKLNIPLQILNLCTSSFIEKKIKSPH